MRHPDTWSNMIPGLSLKVTVDEMNIWISRLSKAQGSPQCEWASSSQWQVWLEQKDWPFHMKRESYGQSSNWDTDVVPFERLQVKQAFSWVRNLRAFLLQPGCLLSWVSSIDHLADPGACQPPWSHESILYNKPHPYYQWQWDTRQVKLTSWGSRTWSPGSGRQGRLQEPEVSPPTFSAWNSGKCRQWVLQGP